MGVNAPRRAAPGCPRRNKRLFTRITPLMRTLFASVCLAFLAAAAPAATGPVRVLYHDAAGAEQTAKGHLHPLMLSLIHI